MADRRNGLCVQRLRRVAFSWGTISRTDAHFFHLCAHVVQHILKTQIGISTKLYSMTHALSGSFNYQSLSSKRLFKNNDFAEFWFLNNN